VKGIKLKTQTKPTEPAIWLTVEEAAKRLRISRSILYRLLTSGDVPSFTVPGTKSRRIDAAELESWAASASGKRAA